eukprot:569914-Pelagomonas_calceolata.AAC.1
MLESERKGPESKEASFSRREQTKGVTGRRNVVNPSSSLNLKSVDTKAKLGHGAHGLEDNKQKVVFNQVSRPEVNHKLAQIQQIS